LLNKLSFGNFQTHGTALFHRCDYGTRRVYASDKPMTAHNSDGGEGNNDSNGEGETAAEGDSVSSV
jgi:hypothetical protein